jgi:hypothetical protein
MELVQRLDCKIKLILNIINNSETITVRIPNKKEKTFSKKNMSLSEKITLAIEYKKLQS